MLRIIARCAALGLTGGALALAGTTLPAQAATTGWRINTTVAVSGKETIEWSVAAASAGDAWASGFTANKSGTKTQLLIRHWAGKSWRSVTVPASTLKKFNKELFIESQIAASSTKNVWDFGSLAGDYLRLKGKSWSIGKLPGTGREDLIEVEAAKAFSNSSIWAVGTRESLSTSVAVTSAYAAHYNGHSWSRTTLPALSAGEDGNIVAISASSANSIWAVEDTEVPPASASGNETAETPVVLHWTSSAGWQALATQPTLAAGDQLSSVAAEPNGDIWFGGSTANTAKGTTPLAAEWNGTTWSVASLPVTASSARWSLTAMTPDGSDGAWAIGGATNRSYQRIWRLHGSTWTQVTPGFSKHKWVLESLAQVPHTTSVWGAGAIREGSKVEGLLAVEGATPK